MCSISIITVNLNNLHGLQRTVESVFEQTFTNYEYIAIDGGSTDGSKEYIEKHADKFTSWVSEPDGGIYSAMNKGIRKATGEYLLFLNSGDYLINEKSLESFWSEVDGEDMVYGNTILAEKEGFQKMEYPDKITFSFFLENSLPHQNSLIKRELFDRVGLYNESVRTTSDWAFFMDAICKYGATYKRVDRSMAVFDLTGITSQNENWVWINKDKERLLKEGGYWPFVADGRELIEKRKELIEIKRKLALVENSRWWKLRKLLFKQ